MSFSFVSAQLPAWKIALRIIAPQIIAPWMIAPRIIASRTIAPDKNYPSDNCPADNYPQGKLAPRKIASDSCPLHDCSHKITPKINAIWQYPSGNSPRGKQQFFGIILPRKTSPGTLSRNRLHTIYFSPRIRNRSTLVDSCFLLLSFFVV